MNINSMDLAFAGLYAKLKDRNISLVDKLQVFRFAWKSKDVFIPNKEQVLIDLLCGYLVNKKKHQFTEEEIWKIFKCMHDVLLSKKAHKKQSDGQGLLVKQSLSQMVTETLWSKINGEDHLEHVMGCCHAIITSPTINYVFTDRLDLMVSLLGCLCALLYKSIVDRREHMQLNALIESTTDLFIEHQHSAHDQNMILKVTLEKFLPSFIKLCSVCNTEEVSRMVNVLLNVLCHKDHGWSYRAYLLGLYENYLPVETEFTTIQLTNQVFKTFSDLLESEPKASEAVIDILVSLFERSAVNKKSEEDLKVSFYLLKKLCALIGVNEADSTLSGKVAPSAVIKGIERLLQIVLSHALYNVSADNRNGYPQLKFYRTIVKILLENISHTTDWYSCCYTLLQLNHHTIEPSLHGILMKGWISVKKQSDEVLSQIDNFLQELITTYHKLRQFPKMIDVLITTFKSYSGDVQIELPPTFLKSYGECIQSLPQATMVTVWTKYLDHMIQEFVTEQPSSTNTCHFHGVCSLFYHFITNVKVIDFSVTELTLTSVKDNLEKMSTELFKALLKETEQMDVASLGSILNLCHGWGEVVALVVMYTQHNMEELRLKSVRPEPHDLSYLHTYLMKNHWKLLHKQVEMAGNMGLQYYWDMLMVQKIRTVMLCRDVSDWSAVHESMEALIKFPVVVSQEKKKATWSGLVNDVTDDNILVARWHLIVSNMAILYANLSQENMEAIATFIVNTATGMEGSPRTVLTLCNITKGLMESTQINEYGGLITCIFTAVWQSLTDREFKPRSKKRKLDIFQEAAMGVYQVISDTEVDWRQAINSEMLEKVLKASKCLTSMLKNFDESQACIQRSRFTSCLQVIRWLPLEHISSIDQIRCLIGLLSSKCLIDSEKNQSDSKEQGNMSGECIKLCTVILESSGMSPIFQVIDMDTYFIWLTTLLPKQTKMDSNFFEVMLFIEYSCWSIVKDYKVLTNLLAFVQKLQRDITQEELGGESHTGILVLFMYLLQETNKMLSRSYLNEGLKDSCLAVQKCLSTEILRLTSVLRNPSYGLTEAVVVNSLSTMVHTSVKVQDLQGVLSEKIPDILNWCKHVLQNVSELFPKMAALHFLQSVSRCHKVFDLVFLAAAKHEIWIILVGLLKDLLKKNSSVLDSTKTVAHKDRKPSRASEDQKPRMADEAEYETIVNLLDESSPVTDKLLEENNDKNKTDVELVTLTCDSLSKPFSEDKVYRSSIISNLFHSLVFEGKLEDQSTSLLLMEVQVLMASLLASFDLDNFTAVVENLVDEMHTCNLTTERQTIQCYLFVWRYLLKLEFSDEHSQCIRAAAEKMVSNSLCILQQVQHHKSPEVVMDTVLPILRSLCQMLTISKRFLSAKSAGLCLQGCTSVSLEGATLFPVFHAMCDLLDTLLVQHTNIVLQNIPAFMGSAKKLLVSLVKHSDQKTLAGNTMAISNLSNCAYMLERLFLEISNHKVAFNKVAVYVISDYVTAVEQVTLLPSLKRALLPVVYKMLDLCDNFSISQLHKILSYGEVAVFKILFNEYRKFHKFSGKV